MPLELVGFEEEEFLRVLEGRAKDGGKLKIVELAPVLDPTLT